MQNNRNRHFTSVNLNEEDTHFKAVMALFENVGGAFYKKDFFF
jgi:hypothetical protein